MRWTSASLETSPATATAWPSRPATVSSAAAARTSLATTRAPSRTKARVATRPIPPPAPVISATFPSSLPMTFLRTTGERGSAPLASQFWLRRADLGQLPFNGRHLFGCPLDARALEPILGPQLPPAARKQEDDQHRHRGVVEVRLQVGRVAGGQHEEDGDERHPDGGDHANQRAPPAQMPRSPLEPIAESKPKDDRQDVCDVEPDGR